MAEENQEEQQNKGHGFYPFSMHKNEEVLETRERLKNNFDFNLVLDVFGKDEDGKPVDVENLLKNLREEITNLRKALKDGGEINTRLIKDGDLPYWADCIKDRSDYLQNYQDTYKAYEAERSHIVAEIEELKAARDAALKAAEEKAGTDEAEQALAKVEQLKTQIEETEQKRDALTEKDAYKDAVLAHDKFETAEHTIKKVLEGDIGLLSELPQETMENLLQFKEKCGEENKELFNEAYEALFMSRPYGPAYVYETDREGKPRTDREGHFIKKTDIEGRIINCLRLWNMESSLFSENALTFKLLKENFNTDIKIMRTDRNGIKLKDRVFLQQDKVFFWPDIKREPEFFEGKCFGLKSHIGILVDGTVVPCCLDSGGNINLGNIFDENLSDILQSERALNIVEGFRRNKRVEHLCTTCGWNFNM